MAQIQLLRSLSQVFSAAKSEAKYDLLFVMAAATREVQWKGFQHWLESVEPELSQPLHYALIIDDISRDQLYLHSSRPPKDTITKNVYDV